MTRTPGFRRLSGDEALPKEEAAVESPFAGPDQGIRLTRFVVKLPSPDRAHRNRSAFRDVDLGLDLALHLRQLAGACLHCHPARWLGDGGIKREHREDRARRRRAVDAWQTDRPTVDGLASDRLGREVLIDDGEDVAVTHRCEHAEKLSGQQRIDVLEHAGQDIDPLDAA